MKETGNKTKWPYEDIVNLPHHVSKKHPQMSLERRAAQFAPFAALSGFQEAIEEIIHTGDGSLCDFNTEGQFFES